MVTMSHAVSVPSLNSRSSATHFWRSTDGTPRSRLYRDPHTDKCLSKLAIAHHRPYKRLFQYFRRRPQTKCRSHCQRNIVPSDQFKWRRVRTSNRVRHSETVEFHKLLIDPTPAACRL